MHKPGVFMPILKLYELIKIILILQYFPNIERIHQQYYTVSLTVSGFFRVYYHK